MPVLAGALDPVNIAPADFAEVQTILGEIETDLEAAHCGGWDFDQPVMPHMSRVTGVPGRYADPLGHIKSGMAQRIETGGVDVDANGAGGTGLQFPDTTRGFVTACRPGDPPFLEAFPCQRPAGVNQGFPGPDIYKPPSKACEGADPAVCSNSDPFIDPNDPSAQGVQWTCNALCNDLNRRWIYKVWDLFCPAGDPPVMVDTNQDVRSQCYDADTQDEPPPPPVTGGCDLRNKRDYYCCTQEPVSGGRPNCIPCAGQDCRTPDFPPYGEYMSYYRRYTGTCERAPVVPAVPDDNAVQRDVPVSCYGFYNEYDPKDTVSGPWDRHCTIGNTYANAGIDFATMETTQKSAFGLDQAEFGKERIDTPLADGGWPDPPDPTYSAPRNTAFQLEPTSTIEADFWYPNIGGGFSLTNGVPLQDDHNNDLNFALMSPDMAQFKAYPQLSVTQPLSSGGLLRSFEDSVSNDRRERRTIAEWWQELSTESHKLFTPAQVRLLLPPAWSLGLDPLDPFFTPELPDPANPPPATDPKSQPLEVMLQAKEDLLGAVAAYMERSLILRLREEPIPVVVPFGSPTEFRSAAQDWCTWILKEKAKEVTAARALPAANEPNPTPPDLNSLAGITDCKTVVATNPRVAEAQILINRLEEYGYRIDEVRQLRTELYQYQLVLLEHQSQIIEALGNWLKDNIDAYNAYRDQIDTLDSLNELWKRTQELYRTFHDKTNQPWCMNHRYTTSIYSLLDEQFWFPGDPDPRPWFPGRPALDAGIDEPPEVDNVDTLPRFTTDMPPDAVLDFSLFRSATGAIAFPVLKPIEVSVDIRHPGAIVKEVPVLPPLPAMPSIADNVQDYFDNTVEYYKENDPPDITTFFPGTPPSISNDVYIRSYAIISAMNDTYQKFWDSLSRKPDDVTDGTEEDCLLADIHPCVHVEWDLIERFVRMCARPAVFLHEDFQSIGQHQVPQNIDFDECSQDPARRDWTCQPLNQEKVYTGKGWGLRAPAESKQAEFIDAQRQEMIDQSLLRTGVPEEDLVPYVVDPAEMLPSFESRPPVPLLEDHNAEDLLKSLSP